MKVEIRIGDCRKLLAAMPDESVHCVVTSPPYWGLRCYGVDGQMGQEAALAEHIAVMVEVFREVRRVLRKDGTLWLNYGDGYSPGGNGSRDPDLWPKQSRNDHRVEHSKATGELKPKDLLMMSNRLAIALQDDGWWVRSEIIWFKPNPMPESVQDRPTSAHEKIWLMSKSARYWYDAEAVQQQSISGDLRRPYAPGQVDKRGNGHDRGGGQLREIAKGFRGGSYVGGKPGPRQETGNQYADVGANLRNVWTVATRPFKESHFATFPPDLIVPCIKAGCPAGGTVLDPFGGAGTTGLVADRLGRNAILLELNPEYAEMARRRIEDEAGMFVETVLAANA